MFRTLADLNGNQDDPVRSKVVLERIPAGRWGEPEYFLASSASDYLHGSIVLVDGVWIGR